MRATATTAVEIDRSASNPPAVAKCRDRARAGWCWSFGPPQIERSLIRLHRRRIHGSDSQDNSGLRKIIRKVSLDFAKFDWTGQPPLSRPVQDCEDAPSLAGAR